MKRLTPEQAKLRCYDELLIKERAWQVRSVHNVIHKHDTASIQLQALLDYCTLDTLVMVKIVRKLIR